MEVHYAVPRIPREFFRYQGTPEQGIVKEKPVAFIVKEMELTPKGIIIHYKGMDHPRKGFEYPEAVAATNTVKRVLMESIRTLTIPQFTLSWVISLFTSTKVVRIVHGHPNGTRKQRVLEKLLQSFNRISYGIVAHHMLTPEAMTPLAAEFQGVLYAFLNKLGIEDGTSRQFALIFGTLLQYDMAYRFRLQDIFSLTNKKDLEENPYKEIKRILPIYLQREKQWVVANKFKAAAKLIALPFLLPKIKSALKYSLRNCDFERLQLDTDDIYWCSLKEDYDYEGIPFEERKKKFKEGEKFIIESYNGAKI